MDAKIAIIVLKALYQFVRPVLMKAVKESDNKVDDFILEIFDKILK